MMRTALTTAVAILLALSTIHADGRSLAYPCFRTASPPTIDGVADDTCWATAPLATGFSILGDGFTDSKQTSVRMCWDGGALYLMVGCEEPDMEEVQTDVRDGGPAWLDDGVEIFLQASEGGQVYQLLVTASAARSAGVGAPDFRQVEAAVSTTERSYALEIAIPHELMRAEPSVGESWRGNIARNIWTTSSGGDRFTSWASLQRQFLEPENFATLEFHGAPPSAETTAALTHDLNRRYREHLLAQVEQLVAQTPDYLPVLERARESERLGGQARRLVYRWYRLERMQEDSLRYTIGELRNMVQNAEDLVGESYEVKYAHLIDGLFSD